MSNQGTIRLKVTNSAPAIEKLWKNRYKLEFFCDNNTPKEDWYYENVSALLPDYGILQTTNFGSGVSEDWEAIPGSVYPDMRLVLAEYPYNVRAGKHYVKLTYETLTASWVEEKDEDTDYELNGLKRVSRTFVALPATTYDKVVGTSTIDSDGTTLYLGSFKIEKTDAKWSLTEVWIEAGTLSETLDNVGSQKAKVIQTIGTDPVAPSGYVLANKSESDFQGFQTNKFTFLKNNSILNTSTNSISDGVVEVSTTFFGTEGTTVGPVISRTTGDVEGIPTITVKTLQDNSGQSISGAGVISEFQQYVDFTYPGEVSIATDTDTVDDPATGDPSYVFKSYWYSLKPPVTRKVLANVSISFQADGNLTTVAPFWSPVGWAKGTVDGLGTNYSIKTVQQTAQDKAFNQYTVVEGGDNSYSGTAGFGNTTGAILLEGTYILPGAAWSINVSGGPGRPDGNTYTIDAKLTPAFVGADGTQYWKKTLVVATIPTR